MKPELQPQPPAPSLVRDIPEIKIELAKAHSKVAIDGAKNGEILKNLVPHLGRGKAYLEGVELVWAKHFLRLAPEGTSEYPPGHFTFDNMITEAGSKHMLVEIVVDTNGKVVDVAAPRQHLRAVN